METVAIAIGSFLLYLLAYHTYGKYLARRVFRIDPQRPAPAVELEDGVDYVPSRKELVFGHHFTSIAGTGPIVGPAIAVVWGWVPALVWVLIGSIVMGAVHDFGSLIISMRHRGRTIADLSRDVINPRVRLLFMLVVLIGLWIVLAVFGLVIATIFKIYPSAVMPSFLQIPIAVALGIWLRRGGSLLVGTVVAVVLMYASIAVAANYQWAQWTFPVSVTQHVSANVLWTLILLVYVFIASVLPVQWLLQPRDYINSHQLLIAMGLLLVGIAVAHPPIVADALVTRPAPAANGAAAPPFIPFLFVTIACGAISGFHCLVASGCSSRQLRSEADAQYVGYGAMLTEGFLAVLVILACAAGIGMGTTGTPASPVTGGSATGRAAWLHHYAAWGGDGGLGSTLAPFVTGSANMIEAVGLSHALAIAIMGVFVASFAATTLDSATRLQRYVISELCGVGAMTGHDLCTACGHSLKGLDADAACPECGRQERGGPRRPASVAATILGGRYGATALAVLSAGALALSDAFTRGLAGAGLGGLILWPIFGATNQLLGGLALLVVTVWLVRTGRPCWVTAIPMTFMLLMTGWAIAELVGTFARGEGKMHLAVISAAMLAMEIWIVAEAAILVLRPRAPRVAAEP